MWPQAFKNVRIVKWHNGIDVEYEETRVMQAIQLLVVELELVKTVLIRSLRSARNSHLYATYLSEAWHMLEMRAPLLSCFCVFLLREPAPERNQ